MTSLSCRARGSTRLRYACHLCARALVRKKGGVCFKCWHRIEFGRLTGKPAALFEQLPLFDDGAVEKREPLT